MNKRYKTQWIGQYAVSSELTRRDYLTAMPLGNTPIRDLICRSPSGKDFSVQVKSLSSKGFFPLQKSLTEKEIKNLYFVFVHVPSKLTDPLEYFILSHSQLLDVWKKENEYWKQKEQRRGKPYKEWSEAVRYKSLLDFKGKWAENLPA